uniref:Calpain catalytic domain-containing protein n=1 Tax=Acrobeloides nanus TaxID=290746 RepID=A0A914BUM7_9BILA
MLPVVKNLKSGASIGKIILDNIISGKFKKKVEPFVPSGRQPIVFYAEKERCLREGCLFEDPQFPADVSSLYYSHSPKKEINWKRPGEIVKEPILLVDGHSRFDVVPGELEDYWFLAAIANITTRDELFYRVVPPDQSFSEDYAGIFHFQFWQYGKWVDVVIDDRLPTHNGQLIYMHSRNHNEFWSALLEKAYAKLYGSYEALKSGLTSEALEDMTGGLAERMKLEEDRSEVLWHIIMRGLKMGSIFGCSIDADPASYENKLSTGLVQGHAYNITGIRMVNGPKGQTTLLRIRNPWGKQEWKGPWSDESPEWHSVPKNIKGEMDAVVAQNGEFWIAFDDLLKNFKEIDVCHLGPDVIEEIFQMTEVRAPYKPWDMVVFEGAWIRGSTAGGCSKYLETFPMNPQYPLKLKANGTSTMIVALIQKYRRGLRKEGLKNLDIGFSIYHQGSSTKIDFENAKCINSKYNFINRREVIGRFETNAGEYIILPSTLEPNEEAEFILRIFSNGSISS